METGYLTPDSTPDMVHVIPMANGSNIESQSGPPSTNRRPLGCHRVGAKHLEAAKDCEKCGRNIVCQRHDNDYLVPAVLKSRKDMSCVADRQLTKPWPPLNRNVGQRGQSIPEYRSAPPHWRAILGPFRILTYNLRALDQCAGPSIADGRRIYVSPQLDTLGLCDIFLGNCPLIGAHYCGLSRLRKDNDFRS
jgi:hypothetical protein